MAGLGNIEFTTGGKFKVSMRLGNVVKSSNKDVSLAMKSAAAALQKKIRAAARVDTGFMKAHTFVTARTTGKNPAINVRSTDYAIFLDQGTVHIEPDFFITGTLAQERKRVEKLIGTAVKKSQAKRAKKAARRRARRR